MEGVESGSQRLDWTGLVWTGLTGHCSANSEQQCMSSFFLFCSFGKTALQPLRDIEWKGIIHTCTGSHATQCLIDILYICTGNMAKSSVFLF